MITGVWTALPPVYAILDDEALGGTLDHLFGSGVDGIFLLGTTGLGADFSTTERMHVLDRVAALVEDTQNLVVAVSANAPTDVRQLISHAADSGVKGIAITPPFYGSFSDEDMQVWLKKVFERRRKEVEVFLYNMPSATHQTWSLPLVQFVDDLVGVDGIKDSSGSVSQFLQYLQWAHSSRQSVLVGDERLAVYSSVMGGQGIVSGLSAVFPKLLVDLVAFVKNRDWPHAQSAQVDVQKHLGRLEGKSPREAVIILMAWMKEYGIIPL